MKISTYWLVSVFAVNINTYTALKTSDSTLPRNLGYENLYVRILKSEFLNFTGEEDAGKQIKYHVTKKFFKCLFTVTDRIPRARGVAN